jgi:5-methyltetrahydropteroyltriglutamate--homocysteine methyltransferase
MSIQATMTGSWFRPPEIAALLFQSPTGELGPDHRKLVEDAERTAVREQLHPHGAKFGLTFVSNGEQRKAGYTNFLPNRFDGFSKTERAPMQFPEVLIKEFQESNPALLQALQGQQGGPFQAPVIEGRLAYRGEALAKEEAQQAARLAKEEKAPRIFVPSPSPGVTTIFFPRSAVYKTHRDYLFDLAKELRKEYKAILSVAGVDLQIDAPDLAMGRNTAAWGAEFYEYLPQHVDAINEAIAGLPADRIRVHYCYGNYLASHRNDPEYARVLPELVRLKAGTIVGEAANPRHEGDALIVEDHVKEHGWPKGLKFAVGVVDVKTPFVETPETIATRLERFGRIEGFDPKNLLGGTDCGFQTFLGFDNVTHEVALHKLESLGKGAALASKRLGVK